MLCCVLGTDWRELEVAFDRLVSLEREASTGVSEKGIHNSYHSVCVESAWMYGSLRDGGEAIATSRVGICVELDTSTVVSMVVQLLQLRACGVLT